MSQLKNKVLESLKWKKGAEYCAKRLGMSVTEYSKIKQQILSKKSFYKESKVNKKEEKSVFIDLEKGEAKYNLVSKTEPKTPEEIIKLLKLDTTKWKLSSYWNKEMSDHWRISAMVTQVKNNEEVLLKNLIDNWNPRKHYISTKPVVKDSGLKQTVCGVMSLQDIHFGKEGNETIDKDFEDAITDLMYRASSSHFMDKLYFVIGGDLINMDTFGGTTTSGTPVDNSMKATDAYIQAFDAMHWAINYMKHFCNKLVVVYVPGNHDRLSSFHLVQGLSRSIVSEDIEWDVSYAERKIHVWGENFNAFEHGDVSSKNTPLVYAVEFPVEWGSCKYRTLFTGHYHQNKKIEYVTTSENVGFVHKTLPSLCRSDYYHYHNKYVGNRRSAVLELQSSGKGTVCELVYSAE
ncbi:MAG: hypothetical protein E6R13_07665 [Spirochaetes bacterium]|nr:MAG: hypothetical protein E6R13_07665 [Spirochaetota bacterium]